MATQTMPPEWAQVSPAIPGAAVKRFSVKEYHRLIDIGFFAPDDKLELVQGWLVHKVSHTPPHAVSLTCLLRQLYRIIPEGWEIRSQLPITTSDSEPEPDIAVVRGSLETYMTAHPKPKDVSLVVEIAKTSAGYDRGVKLKLYAANRIPSYWIINVDDGLVEVYTQPRGGKSPTYRSREDFAAGTEVPVTLDGKEVGRIPVLAIMPFLGG